jgi:hypothetical protein
MCLIVAVILGVLAWNAFWAKQYLLAFLALAGALFFIILMWRNIVRMRKLNQKDDYDH